MIFIWIPKTGGTSFVKEYGITVLTDRYDRIHQLPLGDITFGHACPRELIKNGFIQDRWHFDEVVATVRDPYSRFLSLYYDYKRTARIPMGMNQREFAHAIKEMSAKPGLFNSQGLSMCAPQVEWLLPGVEIRKLEKLNLPVENVGNHGGWDDSDARELVEHIYAVDFVTLGYNTQC